MPDTEPFNPDKELHNLPKTQEYLEVIQQQANERRKSFQDSLNDADKIKFKKVEEIVASLQDIDIPFTLFVNPLGYDIDHSKRSGFWRYQKLHPTGMDAYDKDFEVKYGKICQDLFGAFFGYVTAIAPNFVISVKDKKTGKTVFEYEK